MKWFDLTLYGDTAEKGHYMSSKGDLQGYKNWHFTMAKKIENWDGTAWLKSVERYFDGSPTDVLGNDYALPIYSQKLRDALDKAGITGIQYLPIKVYHRNGDEIKGYAIANILNIVPALDLSKSDYQVYPNDHFLPERRGKVRYVGKFVLKKSKLNGYDVIRLVDYDVVELVSSRFKEAFEKAKCNGYTFTEVELS